ncbi:hypothetical protein CAPTEDRAFT_223168 [Capitella teleta]|uniref:KASH domain-containing protein n=1 Tax=Capitella teleta TaxID=283909 RepID=R7TDE7_CAPTE|nr:hypothetical protein CAPTEDRAFT_223168 [Capitella teleta]|eukprot:ELT91753.1 hypothetical protein CAPTEDRAFT_223168 [Capitella teleta]
MVLCGCGLNIESISLEPERKSWQNFKLSSFEGLEEAVCAALPWIVASIKRTLDRLQCNPDTLLYSDLSVLQHAWKQLHHRLHPKETPPKKSFHNPRQHFNKLSTPYRVFIKSRVTPRSVRRFRKPSREEPTSDYEESSVVDSEEDEEISNLCLVKSCFPLSLVNIVMASESPKRPSSPRDFNPSLAPKRRRMNSMSPNNFDFDDSFSSSPGSRSPSGSPTDMKMKKDMLWAAIQSDYHYLMDKEIIETCKSTESDLSWESDDPSGCLSTVSFTEFVQQFTELTEWLTQIQLATQRQSSTLSEKYLNQSYHEEMLQRSSRRKLFNDYAKQTMRRYPALKEEISVRLARLNTQWAALEAAMSPWQQTHDEATMLKDLDHDLTAFRSWLEDVDLQLQPLALDESWTRKEIQEKLAAHKLLQQGIEARSSIVSAVLKLCDRLRAPPHDTEAEVKAEAESEKQSLRLLATTLEGRWHTCWLQSLEWQCRLEEALVGPLPRKRHPVPGSYNDDSGVWSSDTSITSPRSADPLLAEISEEDPVGSSHDVIPFSESEYEKIHDDDGSMEHGLDSALGRSVSDEHTDKMGCRCRVTDSHDIGYSSESHSNEEQALDANRNPKWRNSSAYDSNEEQERRGLPSVDTNENIRELAEEQDVLPVVTTPTPHVYKLTSIETDSEPISTELRVKDDEYRSDADTEVSRSLDLPFDDVPITYEDPHSVESEETLMKKSSSLQFHLELECNSESRPVSLDAQVDSDSSARHQALTEEEEEEKEPAKKPCARRLMLQVESLVKDPEVGQPVRKRRFLKSSVLSSCDASSEESDEESSSEGELCKGRYPSGTRSLRVSPFKDMGHTRKRRSRPHSMIEQYSVSESALPDLWSASSEINDRLLAHKLRRTASDGSCSSSRKHKKRQRQVTLKGSSPDECATPLQLSVSVLKNSSAEDTFVSGHSATEEPLTSSPKTIISREKAETDDTDCVAQSLNSTIESFSEHAWDNYQASPYPTASDDPDEEKLDASRLQEDWDGLEDYDEDFSLRAAPRKRTTSKLSSSLLNDSTRTLEDSEDSDLEDFHHVINESMKALNFTRSTLFNFQKEPVAPTEYDDPIATCRLNVRCLQEVIDTLDSEGLNLDQHEIQQILEVIQSFHTLERSAREQREAAQYLSKIFHQLQGTRTSLTDFTERMDRAQYVQVSDLDAAVKQLLTAKGQLQAHHLPELKTLEDQLQKFALGHKEVSVEKLQEEVIGAHMDVKDSLLRSNKRATELQKALLHWNEFHATGNEAFCLLKQANEQLEALSVVTDSTTDPEDLSGHLSDLKTMLDSFCVCEDKLTALRRLAGEVTSVCGDAAQLDLRATIARLDTELTSVRTACQQLGESAELKLFSAREQRVRPATAASPEASDWWRLLRRMLPLALAATLFLTLLCIIDPSFPSRLVFSPRLRYVRGPPPI